jgi:hypothetical protein
VGSAVTASDCRRESAIAKHPLLDQARLTDRLGALERWIDQNGWAGYDPFDIYEPRWIQRALYARSAVVQRLLSSPLSASLQYAPGVWRTVLRVPKRINAKGLGLLARAYVNRHRSTANPRYEAQTRSLLDWLANNPAPGYRGLCWGYPFHWQSRIFIPRGTPSSVVSFVVGDAFFAAYQHFRRQRDLDVCRSVCEFFLKDLNRSEDGDGTWCFSYTPIDRFQVHNANLFVAEFLVRVGTELGEENLVAAGLRGGEFSLRQQHADGSLDYWGRAQNDQPPNTNDHYHIGFEIRSLWGIWRATGLTQYRDAARRYYAYYRSRLFFEAGGELAPRFSPHHVYPIDIHTCAEAIYLNATLASECPEAKALVPRLFDWVTRRMSGQDGSFYYRIYHHYGIDMVDRTPHLRWGQAWMLLALSSLDAVPADA